MIGISIYYYYYYSQFVVESSIPNSFSYTNNNTISSFSTIALFDTFNKHQPAIFFTNPSHIYNIVVVVFFYSILTIHPGPLPFRSNRHVWRSYWRSLLRMLRGDRECKMESPTTDHSPFCGEDYEHIQIPEPRAQKARTL